MELSLFKYDAIRLLGTLPIRMMAVIWDPISSKGIIPISQHIPYLYNFEIYHARQLTLLQQQQEAEQAAALQAMTSWDELELKYYKN